MLRFVKLSDRAFMPTRETEHSVGLDLFSPIDYMLKPKEQVCIYTDLQVEIPFGSYGRIAPRSSLAAQYSIDVGAGVIDPDYRGNIGVVLFNHGTQPFPIPRGRRIAQLIIEQIYYLQPILVEALGPTDRGIQGLGFPGAYCGPMNPHYPHH